MAFELEDTHCNGGGFCCARHPHPLSKPHGSQLARCSRAGIPGSHKSNIQLPDHYRSLPEGLQPVVCPVPAAAGDAILFTESLTQCAPPLSPPACKLLSAPPLSASLGVQRHVAVECGGAHADDALLQVQRERLQLLGGVLRPG